VYALWLKPLSDPPCVQRSMIVSPTLALAAGANAKAATVASDAAVGARRSLIVWLSGRIDLIGG
jgi:hypothetical protein